MAIRFTTFLKHGGEDVSMYVMQESPELDNTTFQVQIKSGENRTTDLWKKTGEVWEINSTQSFPGWLEMLKYPITQILEKRIDECKY